MAGHDRAYSVFDLLLQKEKKEIQAKLDEQIQSTPSLSGFTGATNARLKPGHAWRIIAVQSWYPDPVETPMLVNKEQMAAARPRFTPYGMVYKPYADDSIAYDLTASPAPMSVEMEIQLEAVIEAYNKSAVSDDGKVTIHTVTKQFLLPARLDMNTLSLKPGNLSPFSSFSAASGRICLSEFLLPLNWDDAACDLFALRILSEFMPECLQHKLPLDAYELARRMGLYLRWKMLSSDFSILAELFDKPCKIPVIDLYSQEASRDFHVDAGTILLDERLRSGDQYPIEVIYATLVTACVHWYKDRMFFALQNAFPPHPQLSLCRISPNSLTNSLSGLELENHLNANLPSSQMEAQALAITPHIQINAMSGREKVSDIVRVFGGKITADNYFAIIDEIRSFFAVTEYAADKRLREFGYRIPALSGSFRRFQYKRRPDSGIVYELSLDRLLELDDEQLYPDFTRQISMGNYVYVDYRLCLNTPDYVEVDAAGRPHLTILARSNPAGCCIPFRAVPAKEPDTESGDMAFSRIEAERLVPVSGLPLPVMEKNVALTEAELRNPSDFDAMSLGQEMDYLRTHPVEITWKSWSKRSFVSERKLRQYCRDPVKSPPEFRTFLRAIFSLQINGTLSISLIKKAGLEFPDTANQAKAIRLALKTLYIHPITEIHQLLTRYGFQLIKPGDLKKEEALSRRDSSSNLGQNRAGPANDQH